VIHKTKDLLREKPPLEVNDRAYASFRGQGIQLVNRSDQLDGTFSPQLTPPRSTEPVPKSANQIGIHIHDVSARCP